MNIIIIKVQDKRNHQKQGFYKKRKSRDESGTFQREKGNTADKK